MYLELEAQLKAFGGSFLWIFDFLLKIPPPQFYTLQYIFAKESGAYQKYWKLLVQLFHSFHFWKL